MLLAVLFFITALVYACVGLGGGSSYNALLVLNGMDYRVLPCIAMLCNIIVVSGGVFHFARAGHIRVGESLPWILVSVPAAWLGGYVDISKVAFTGLLGGALFLSGVRMLWSAPDHTPPDVDSSCERRYSPFLPSVIGGLLGFLAGLTGIGGGIFLAPVLHLLRWSHAKNIAGMCSLFILVNSIAGLAGHAMKGDGRAILASVVTYWILFPSVFIGGQIGSWMGSSRIRIDVVKKLTALLILYVSARLIWSWVVSLFFEGQL